MRQEVERAAGEVNGNIAVVEEHRPESGRSAIGGGSGNVRKSEACNLHLRNEDAVLGRHSLYATSTHGQSAVGCGQNARSGTTLGEAFALTVGHFVESLRSAIEHHRVGVAFTQAHSHHRHIVVGQQWERT